MTLIKSDPASAALDTCATEPIRIPGSIQPHGCLLVLDLASFVVVQASANVEHYLGQPAHSLIGQSALALVAEADRERFRTEVADLAEAPDVPLHLSISLAHKGSAQIVDALVHRSGRLTFVEIQEPVWRADNSAAALYPSLITFVTRLQQAKTIDELCSLAVVEVKRLTGFGRVLSYSFNAEGHGKVNAESVDAGYDSFVGLQFPASDIPAQARQLYLANRIRLISDVDYVPSPLVPAEIAGNGPTDLSLVALRSVSPVHLEYMRNMGTAASMSISLVVDGKLWGLISCHHDAPRALGVPTRVTCDLLGKVLSLQLEAREAHADTARRLELRHQLVRMLSSMADHDSVARGMQHIPEVFLDFAGATGAAIVSGDECLKFGDTPESAAIKNICARIGQTRVHDVFHTDSLGTLFPEFADESARASGVLAVAISELHANYIVWFRPEWVRTIDWAGEPGKGSSAEQPKRLSPRQSFQAWQEVVRGYSQPWDASVIDVAGELRTAVLGIVLRKAEELAEMAEELNRTNKELEAFSYSVSHDLRAPLRHIAGYAELLGEYEAGKLSEKGTRYLDNIGESAKFAGTLVDSLLTFSQMGRSALRPTKVDVTRVVDQVRRELSPDVQGRDIEWRVATIPPVYGDAAYLHLALRNLISNAIKYTRTRPHTVIEVGAQPAQNETVFFIKDNGVGFDMKYAPKLFGVFQRLHRMEDFEGTGIGLANVRRIVERHGGRVWAEAAVDQGATFFVALPNSAPKKDIASKKKLQG